MQQARDFYDECMALRQLLEGCEDADYQRETGFKHWTFSTVLTHLTVWNNAVLWSLQDVDKFTALAKDFSAELAQGKSMPELERSILGQLAPAELFDRWWSSCEQVASAFSQVEPALRLPWVGVEMSARSSISARLMESWAHGQAIYDELGVVRQNTDRIHSIVVLGVNTYGWSFKNRGEQAPSPPPYLRLRAPSGSDWEFNPPAKNEQTHERIEGLAEEFCQVVTQTRNIADTRLNVTGTNARRWMAQAQCFAGPPVNPPAAGTRRVRQIGANHAV